MGTVDIYAYFWCFGLDEYDVIDALDGKVDNYNCRAW